MAEKTALQKAKEELAKARAKIAGLEGQMERSGIKAPKEIEGVHTYSGKEKDFEGKKYGIKLGHTRIRVTAVSLGFKKGAKSELFDKKGFLLGEKAIKDADVMNALIERGAGVIEEIKEEAPAAK